VRLFGGWDAEGVVCPLCAVSGVFGWSGRVSRFCLTRFVGCAMGVELRNALGFPTPSGDNTGTDGFFHISGCDPAKYTSVIVGFPWPSWVIRDQLRTVVSTLPSTHDSTVRNPQFPSPSTCAGVGTSAGTV